MGDQNSSVTRRLAYIIVRCVFYSSARGFRHAYRATQADHPRSVFCAVITDRASSVTLTLPGVIVNVIAVADRARNHLPSDETITSPWSYCPALISN